MHRISSINDYTRLGLLHLPDFANLTGITAKRELEKNASLYLLGKMTGENTEITHNSDGKPFLKNNPAHISISHSHDKLAVIINEKNETGIDIELIRDKVLRIQHKFLSQQELEQTNNDVQKLIIYWACKESLYKYYSKKEIDFIHHFYIHPLGHSDTGKIIGEIKLPHFAKKVKLHYEKLDDYILAYTLDEIG